MFYVETTGSPVYKSLFKSDILQLWDIVHDTRRQGLARVQVTISTTIERCSPVTCQDTRTCNSHIIRNQILVLLTKIIVLNILNNYLTYFIRLNCNSSQIYIVQNFQKRQQYNFPQFKADYIWI